MISIEEATGWLHAYGNAWIQQDPGQVEALFTEDALYHETSFDPPLTGRTEIRRYWELGAQQAQRDIDFTSSVSAISADKVIARWTASFVRVPSEVSVDLDGVFEIALGRVEGRLLCSSLREWWFRRETGPNRKG